MKLHHSLVLLASIGCPPPTEPVEPEPEPVVTLPPEALQVEIPAADVTLEGELLLPERTEGSGVRGVVIAHGSGPNGRDGVATGQLSMGFGFEIAVYRELAEALQDRGYAVLRYDKRTCFSGNGCTNSYAFPDSDWGIPEFIADASAALDWLGAREDIADLALVGHSQGASFVPVLARDRGDLAAGVLLSGGYDPVDVLLRYQYDFSVEVLVEAGYTQEQAEAQLTSLDDLASAVEAIAAGTYGAPTAGGAPVSFWEGWLAVGADAIEAAGQTDAALSAITGDYDWNTPPSQTQPWLDAGLDGAIVPCVTHALNCISEPDWLSIQASDIGESIDEGLVDAVVEALGG